MAVQLRDEIILFIQTLFKSEPNLSNQIIPKNPTIQSNDKITDITIKIVFDNRGSSSSLKNISLEFTLLFFIADVKEFSLKLFGMTILVFIDIQRELMNFIVRN